MMLTKTFFSVFSGVQNKYTTQNKNKKRKPREKITKLLIIEVVFNGSTKFKR